MQAFLFLHSINPSRVGPETESLLELGGVDRFRAEGLAAHWYYRSRMPCGYVYMYLPVRVRQRVRGKRAGGS
jgi:hypothetical protein